MITKYGFNVDNKVIEYNINRLTNQIWKLIPMRENGENWKNQLQNNLIELAGMNEILSMNEKYFILLTILEGLRVEEVEFDIYRSKIFETITLLRESYKDAIK